MVLITKKLLEINWFAPSPFPLGSVQNLANAAGVQAGPGPLIPLGGQETGCINRLGKEVNLLRTMGARFLTGRKWSLKYTLWGWAGMGDTGVNSRFFNRWRCFPSAVSWEDLDDSLIARLRPSTRIWVSTRAPSLKGEMAEFRSSARKAQRRQNVRKCLKNAEDLSGVILKVLQLENLEQLQHPNRWNDWLRKSPSGNHHHGKLMAESLTRNRKSHCLKASPHKTFYLVINTKFL